MKTPKVCYICGKVERYGNLNAHRRKHRFTADLPLPENIIRRFIVTDDECWEWQGAIDKRGYSRIGIPKQRGNTGGHQLFYQALIGPVPEGLELDHICCNTRCVNPDHLEPVTRAENMRRRSERRTHCVRGHEYNEINTRINRDGSRSCRPCDRVRTAEHKARKGAAA